MSSLVPGGNLMAGAAGEVGDGYYEEGEEFGYGDSEP